MNIGRSLLCSLIEVTVIIQFYQQTKIQQAIRSAVVTISGNQVFSLFQGRYHFFRQLHLYVLFTSVSCVYNLYSVDIDNHIIIMRIFQIHILTCQVFLNISDTAYPDKFFTPLGLGYMFVLHGSEGTFTFFPGSIIEADILPSVGRLLNCIFSCPVTLFRSFHQRSQFQFLRSHKAVSLSVDFSYTD